MFNLLSSSFYSLTIKRFYRFLLKRLIGTFISPNTSIDLNDLEVDLANGHLCLENVELNHIVLNEYIQGKLKYVLPFKLKSVTIVKVRVEIPWKNIMDESSKIYIDGLNLEIEDHYEEDVYFQDKSQSSSQDSSNLSDLDMLNDFQTDVGVESLSRVLDHILSKMEILLTHVNLNICSVLSLNIYSIFYMSHHSNLKTIKIGLLDVYNLKSHNLVISTNFTDVDPVSIVLEIQDDSFSLHSRIEGISVFLNKTNIATLLYISSLLQSTEEQHEKIVETNLLSENTQKNNTLISTETYLKNALLSDVSSKDFWINLFRFFDEDRLIENNSQIVVDEIPDNSLTTIDDKVKTIYKFKFTLDVDNCITYITPSDYSCSNQEFILQAPNILTTLPRCDEYSIYKITNIKYTIDDSDFSFFIGGGCGLHYSTENNNSGIMNSMMISSQKTASDNNDDDDGLSDVYTSESESVISEICEEDFEDALECQFFDTELLDDLEQDLINAEMMKTQLMFKSCLINNTINNRQQHHHHQRITFDDYIKGNINGWSKTFHSKQIEWTKTNGIIIYPGVLLNFNLSTLVFYMDIVPLLPRRESRVCVGETSLTFPRVSINDLNINLNAIGSDSIDYLLNVKIESILFTSDFKESVRLNNFIPEQYKSITNELNISNIHLFNTKYGLNIDLPKIQIMCEFDDNKDIYRSNNNNDDDEIEEDPNTSWFLVEESVASSTRRNQNIDELLNDSLNTLFQNKSLLNITRIVLTSIDCSFLNLDSIIYLSNLVSLFTFTMSSNISPKDGGKKENKNNSNIINYIPSICIEISKSISVTLQDVIDFKLHHLDFGIFRSQSHNNSVNSDLNLAGRVHYFDLIDLISITPNCHYPIQVLYNSNHLISNGVFTYNLKVFFNDFVYNFDYNNFMEIISKLCDPSLSIIPYPPVLNYRPKDTKYDLRKTHTLINIHLNRSFIMYRPIQLNSISLLLFFTLNFHASGNLKKLNLNISECSVYYRDFTKIGKDIDNNTLFSTEWSKYLIAIQYYYNRLIIDDSDPPVKPHEYLRISDLHLQTKIEIKNIGFVKILSFNKKFIIDLTTFKVELGEIKLTCCADSLLSIIDSITEIQNYQKPEDVKTSIDSLSESAMIDSETESLISGVSEMVFGKNEDNSEENNNIYTPINSHDNDRNDENSSNVKIDDIELKSTKNDHLDFNEDGVHYFEYHGNNNEIKQNSFNTFDIRVDEIKLSFIDGSDWVTLGSHQVMQNNKLLSNSRRNYDKSIGIIIQGFECIYSTDTNNSIMNLTFQDFAIFDGVAKSVFQNILCRAPLMNQESRLNSSFLQCLLKIKNKIEMSIDLYLYPELQITLDQDCVDFLLDIENRIASSFYSESDGICSDHLLVYLPEYETIFDKIMFTRFFLYPITFVIDYRSKRLNMGALSRGDTWELLNVLPLLEGFKIQFRQISINNVYGLNNLLREIAIICRNDLSIDKIAISASQSSLAPVRSITNVSVEFANLIATSMQILTSNNITSNQHRSNSMIQTGLLGAVSEFLKNSTIETADLADRFATSTSTMLTKLNNKQDTQMSQIFNTEEKRDRIHIISPDDDPILEIGDWHTVEEGARKDFPFQPCSISEGLSHGLSVWQRHLAQVKDAAVIEPLNQSSPQGVLISLAKGLPLVFIKPTLGTTEAIASTVRGIRNSLDSGQSRKLREKKYKVPR